MNDLRVIENKTLEWYKATAYNAILLANLCEDCINLQDARKAARAFKKGLYESSEDKENQAAS